MGKTFQESSGRIEFKGNLHDLAESLGNFPPLREPNLAVDIQERKLEKLPTQLPYPFEVKKKLSTEDWFRNSSSSSDNRLPGPAFLTSSHVGSSSESIKDDAASAPASLLSGLRKFGSERDCSSLSLMSLSNASCGLHEESELSGAKTRYLPQFLSNWEAIHCKESQLLEQIRSESVRDPAKSKQLVDELQALLSSKTKLFSLLSASEEGLSEVSQTLETLSGSNSILQIFQQPAQVAIANRYMCPSPVVQVSSKVKPKDENTTLIVTASLFYQNDKEPIKAVDGKQDVLQGTKKVPIDKNGQAVFSKLKITEVSSKHRHQAFCLVFSLEEYHPKGKKEVISSIKSECFYVQSRSNKKPISAQKRRTEDSEENPRKKLKNDRVDDIPPKVDSPNSADGNSASGPEYTENNYVDITDLLTLPQKNAAQQLGISESMLCKRFKECTKRKWPYRYLRKIDKVINMLTENKNGRLPHNEDKQKLARLVEERKECLRPVKIRITVHDKLSSPPSLRRSAPSSPPSPSSEESVDSQIDSQDEEIILETLEMLKSHK